MRTLEQFEKDLDDAKDFSAEFRVIRNTVREILTSLTTTEVGKKEPFYCEEIGTRPGIAPFVLHRGQCDDCKSTIHTK